MKNEKQPETVNTVTNDDGKSWSDFEGEATLADLVDDGKRLEDKSRNEQLSSRRERSAKLAELAMSVDELDKEPIGNFNIPNVEPVNRNS